MRSNGFVIIILAVLLVGVSLSACTTSRNVITSDGKHSTLSTTGEIGNDSRFIAYDNGTVLDTKTNLMWAAKNNGAGINWAGAKFYCENFSGGGYPDWRLPTQDELESLYDKTKINKYNDKHNNKHDYYVHLTDLISLTSNWLWASEIMDNSAAIFSLYTGRRDWLLRSYDRNLRVLPVRFAK